MSDDSATLLAWLNSASQDDRVIQVEEECRLDSDSAIPSEEVRAFMVATADAAGWPFTDVVDVVVRPIRLADGHRGRYEPSTRTMVLDPEWLTRWTVLHELAHVVSNRSAEELLAGVDHGAQFTAALVDLVAHGIGRDEAEELLEGLEALGAEVDEEWLHVDRWPPWSPPPGTLDP